MSTAKTLNLSETERMASLIGGGALVAYGLHKRSWAGLGMAAAGSLLAYRAVSAGKAANKIQARRGHNVSVAYETGTRVDGSVTVNVPRVEAYRFWRNLENAPKFMHLIHSVKEIDNKTSHWVANAPAGSSVEWTAEVINEVENALLAWRSVSGDIRTAGSVQFKDAPGGGTVILLESQYSGPGGKVAAWLAKLAGGDPAVQLERDRQCFKQLMETGEARAKSSGASKKGWVRDEVGQASEESFPASDPPSWTPESVAH
jgi:uncharacterized membrane protein